MFICDRFCTGSTFFMLTDNYLERFRPFGPARGSVTLDSRQWLDKVSQKRSFVRNVNSRRQDSDRSDAKCLKTLLETAPLDTYLVCTLLRGSSMRVGYARVSTRDQNPSLQIDALRANGCEQLFIEHASGARRDRPELQAALKFMRKSDVLVVWKLDRLARSVKQLIDTVEELSAKGVDLVSLQDPVDTTTSAGRLMFHVYATLAEFERSVIRDRTLAGLAAAREKGDVGGRPRSLTNEDLSAAKALLKDSDLSVAEIARRLNVSPATLYRYVPGGRSAANC
jgi:DNA invertase Pin-like site-specific DNA recombinase